MGHAPVRIFKGILGEIDGRTLAGEIVKFALLHGFANFFVD